MYCYGPWLFIIFTDKVTFCYFQKHHEVASNKTLLHSTIRINDLNHKSINLFFRDKDIKCEFIALSVNE